ncbi:NACHT domain-containing NTPase [Vallitalea sediminicola]
MKNNNRDDFNEKTKIKLAQRVAYICSNPNCRNMTVGPNKDSNKSTITGVAAHIKAAAPGGPRYDCDMTSEERCSITNGIWLCCTCSTMIDKDPINYPVELLYRWKTDAEACATLLLEKKTKLKTISSMTSKIQYSTVENYINRKIISIDNYNDNYSENRVCYINKNTTLIKTVEENNLIILLGEAGSGKSYQLQQLAYDLSDSKNNLYPALISLYNYIDKEIEDIIPKEYTDILYSDKILTLILDGYDEIQDKDSRNFIRRINSFINHNIKLVISTRTNFYKSAIFKKFKQYYILDLEYEDILNYLNKKSINIDEFYKDINKNRLKELLKKPFYLTRIVDLYSQSKSLPKKTELMDELIDDSFNFDSNHYITTKDISEEKMELFNLLEKVSFSLVCLEKNYLSDDEYQKEFNKAERELLKYSGIWKKNNDNNWRFIHNNFCEYLAAKLISKKSIEEIVRLITYSNRKSIKPSWVNTLSYITNIYKDNNLKNWLYKNSPKQLIKFEKDRFTNKERVEIFKKIFHTYSDKAIWIEYDVKKDLVAFDESRRTLLFLLNEIKKPKNIQSLKNSLDLLGEFNKTFNLSPEIIEILSVYIFDDKNDEYIINRGILALANLRIQNKNLTIKLMKYFKNSDKSYIRYSIYKYLNTSQYLDENIHFFVDGIKYCYWIKIDNKEIRVSNESLELLNGISKISTIKAFEKIIKALIIYNKSNCIYSIETLIKTTLKLAEKLYCKSRTIVFNRVYILTINTYERYIGLNKNFITFFTNTNSREKVFGKLAKDDNYKFHYIIHNFYYDGCYNKFVKMYQQGKLKDDTAISFAIKMNQNAKEFIKLTELIKAKTGKIIIKREHIDYYELHKVGTQKFFNALFDQDKFNKLIYEFINLSKDNNVTIKDSINYRKNINQRKDLDLTVWAIYLDTKQQQMLLSDFLHEVIWIDFSSYQIYEVLNNKDYEVEISCEQKYYIQNYFYVKITSINFSKAIIYKNDNNYSIERCVPQLLFFLTYFNLDCEEKILLNTLIFPYDTNNERQSYFLYIEQRVNLENMKKRVIYNLESKNLMGEVYEEHIKFCIKHNIYYVEYIAKEVCIDKTRNESVKRITIDYLIMLLKDNMLSKDKFYNKIVSKIDEKLLFYVSETLYNHNDKELKDILISRVDISEAKYKLMAYLIKMNSKIGIEYYISLIEKEKQTPTKFSCGEEMTKSIAMINDINNLSYIIRIIDIRFSNGFKDCSLQSLYRSLSDSLYLLGTQNKESYKKVNKELREALSKTDNTSKSENEILKIGFINNALDNLKESYLKNKEGNIIY